jgi:hypothetical protein
MECCPELRNRTELLAIGARVFGNPICNSKKAVDATPRRNPGRERPGHDHFIPDIRVNLAAVPNNRPVNVEKEACQKFLHPDLT